ncbi:MAG: pantetheine-phosphate adenylyltransferase [Limnochordia bacterium]|jgi:pantetheine-phosphate adenylyltransferase
MRRGRRRLRIAVYPGSFDPVTLGHLDIITRAARLFDKLYVAVLSNSSKRDSFFSWHERVEMLRESTSDLPNAYCESFEGLAVEYARRRGAQAIVRGLRAVSDFEYELKLAEANRHLANEIETVFLMTSHQYSFISSSIVREVAQLGGRIDGWVPRCVAHRIAQRYRLDSPT